MKKRIGFLLLFPVLLAACGEGGKPPGNALHLPPPGFVGDGARGAVVYRQQCRSCHGAEAGGSERGPSLLRDIYAPDRHANLAFHLAVKNGVKAHHDNKGNMPPLDVSPEDVEHVIQYVRELQVGAGVFKP
jgi:mono/diheme cytochrome c family protein